jgi:transcriptional regulator with XRE-family HTH domain
MAKNSVGTAARHLRKVNGWTLAEVAAWSGLDVTLISKIEKGARVANEEHIRALAKGLRTTPSRLLGLEA